MKIQLEVGKWYEVRNPKVVESWGFHTKVLIDLKYPIGNDTFWGDSRRFYADGASFSGVSDFDLVKEIQP